MWSSFFENVLQSVTEGTVTQDQARIKLTETIMKAVRFTVCKRGRGGCHGGGQAMGTPAAPHASGSLAPNAPRPEHDREAAAAPAHRGPRCRPPAGPCGASSRRTPFLVLQNGRMDSGGSQPCTRRPGPRHPCPQAAPQPGTSQRAPPSAASSWPGVLKGRGHSALSVTLGAHSALNKYLFLW